MWCYLYNVWRENTQIQVKNLGNNTNLNYYWKLTEWRTCIQWISTSSRSFVSLIFFWYSLKCQSNIPWIANQNPGDFASNNEKTERLQIYSSSDQADSSWNSKAFTVDIKIKHRDYQAPIQKFILKIEILNIKNTIVSWPWSYRHFFVCFFYEEINFPRIL